MVEREIETLGVVWFDSHLGHCGRRSERLWRGSDTLSFSLLHLMLTCESWALPHLEGSTWSEGSLLSFLKGFESPTLRSL